MPNKHSVWDTAAIRTLVCDWYGVHDLPMTLQSREDEINEFQSTHWYIPADWWSVVNHASRHVLLWARDSTDCLDLVVWDTDLQTYRLLQEVCFKDAYPTTTEWYCALQQILQDPTKKVWFVRHES